MTPETAALRSSPVFAGAPSSALQLLAHAASVKTFDPGALIASEGAAFDSAFLVIRGRVRAIRRGENGREVTVETYRAGDVVADGVFEPSHGFATDLTAAEATRLLLMSRDSVLAMLRCCPETGVALGRAYAARLRRTKDLTVGLVLSDVPARVAWALRNLARQEGEALPDGVLVRQRPTQQELANTIGACRETVSRVVSDLTRQGLVTPRGRGLLLSRRLLEGPLAA